MTSTSKQVRQNSYEKAKELKTWTLVRVLLDRHRMSITVVIAIAGWTLAFVENLSYVVPK